ncbi:zinc ribbon domain-containing protein [Gordonia sp. ABSL49_1]|uniref:FmdB family zinc ribbon protein n=1 Tax=Gordonia sp. ABSL49_1 TaxID=2920941 RepID=UPI001F116E7F|nr:zinc ribbon domain-containing protein [Gordonia sp. ABSL49_1]MCH5642964.1 zinc ribbon domain-containing protein [Gordonia sp. ABSL49_1]
MPTYVFRCAAGCDDITQQHSMAQVPDAIECPLCAARARRVIGAPALGVGNTAGMRAQDATRATADRPHVVSIVPSSSGRGAPASSNPLHRKLPRP